MKTVRVAAIIPARMGSSRFPGKPLLNFLGLPMVEHVRRRALLCKEFSDVVVATCDKEIAQAVEGFGGRVIMTKDTHPGATDRVNEAAQHLNVTHVVNVQGDEILIRPEDLTNLVQAIKRQPEIVAWNALAPIRQKQDLEDRSIVKCVVSRSHRVMYCTRDFSRLPFSGDWNPVRIILGILAYDVSFLGQYGRLERTPGELLESIDQNRVIEHDYHLQGLPFSQWYPSVNVREDVGLVEEFAHSDPDQKKILAKIMPKEFSLS